MRTVRHKGCGGRIGMDDDGSACCQRCGATDVGPSERVPPGSVCLSFVLEDPETVRARRARLVAMQAAMIRAHGA